MLLRHLLGPPVVRCCLLIICCGLCPNAVADELPPAVLELSNGDFVRGRLVDISAGKLQWDGEFFTETLQFPQSAVRGMKFPPLGDSMAGQGSLAGQGSFRFELINRDIVLGDLLAINEHDVEVRTRYLGELKLRTNTVRRISRVSPNAKVWRTPVRLSDWTTSDQSHWRSEGDSIVSDEAGASLFADVKLPSQAAIELELAWSGTPSFAFYLGTDGSKDSLERAFSLEVWGKHIVAQRHSPSSADLAALQQIATGSLHIQAYVDQAADKLIVYDAGGATLAELAVSGGKQDDQPGIMLLNRQGNLRLKQLQVRGWSGLKPSEVSTGEFAIEFHRGIRTGAALRLADGELTLTRGQVQERIKLDDVTVIQLPSTPREGQAGFMATYHDGSRVSGELVAGNDRELVVRSAASDDLLRLSLRSLRGFSVDPAGGKGGAAPSTPPDHRAGVLAMMDTQLTGWLVEETPTGEHASCLVWKSALALAASPLRKDVYGRITYVPPKGVVERTATPARRVPADVLVRGFAGRLKARPVVVSDKQQGVGTRELAVHLRSGDTIPCRVVGIDEQGVHIESSITDSKLIPHAEVKAAQLVADVAMPRLGPTKRQRLLTLPRIQKYSPPRHLLFTRQGDVLRGSVVKLDDNELELEIRLAARHLPRSRVATIIWLHEDELNEGADVDANPRRTSDPSPQAIHDLLVQVVRNDGPRYSFVAESFSDQAIHGNSDVLKHLRPSVGEIDQLFLGGFIHRAARSLPYHRWRMTPAVDPKFVQVDGQSQPAEATVPGMESNLVGLPAPDVRLTMMGGEEFRLADHRGHCVVLDFWATWCGPCLQVMPQVEQVVSEFADRNVQLMAINLEELPEHITATLERREINVPVALDRDGVAAARYQAYAIPQTVVIGPDGNIARVFVGATRDLAEQLRAVLTELTKPD